VNDIAKKLKEAFKDPKFRKKFAEGVIKDTEEREENLAELARKNYPGHDDHKMQSGEWDYFDAMFVSVDMECSCGEKLKVTREMTEK